MPGGPLPSEPPFDLFCVCGASTQHFPTYLGVEVVPGDPDHNFSDPEVGTYHLRSNDGVRAGLFVDQALPPKMTLEVIFRTPALPADLATKVRHMFIGLYDDTLSCSGLFVSQNGVAYGSAYDDAPLMLPESSGILLPGGIYVLRVVVDSDTEAAYIFLGELGKALKGHLPLKWTLPLLDTQFAPNHIEGVYLSVLGTEASPSEMAIEAVCLSSQVLLTNRPPIANPGPDQTVRGVGTVLLDGSASRDPEGAPLLYKWRLVSAPDKSDVTHLGLDGSTLPSISGFVDKLYTSHVTGVDSFPVGPGDVVVFEGVTTFITTLDQDMDGWFYQVEGEVLPANKSDRAFQVISQSRLFNRTEAKAKLRPDVPGLFRCELQVSDALLPSSWTSVLVNVLGREQAFGTIPDASWIWNYVSDSWRLLEDPERIESLWSGMFQVLGGEMLRLWQGERSRSLRDIPRQIQRRWLNYDLLLREPFPDLSRVTTRWVGVSSSALNNAGLVTEGQLLVLSVLGWEDLVEVVIPGGAETPALLAKSLDKLLKEKDERFSVEVVPYSATQSRVIVQAPFPFTVPEAPVTTLIGFALGGVNRPVRGDTGTKEDTQVWKADKSLLGMGIKEGDMLAVARLNQNPPSLLRIASVQDVGGDAHKGQRLLLSDPIPADTYGPWEIATCATSPQMHLWKAGVSYRDYAVLRKDSEHRRFRVFGSHPESPFSVYLSLDDEAVQEMGDKTWELWGVYRRTLVAVSDLVTSIPRLQVNPWEGSEARILRENEDYTLVEERGSRFLRFRPFIFDAFEMSPLKMVVRLWAEETYLDNHDQIQNNFGHLVGLTWERSREASPDMDYLSAVRGLWFAFQRGPRIGNLRIASQILLGLPFAEVNSKIVEIDTRYSPTKGRLLLQDKEDPALFRTYTYPRTLDVEVNPATGKTYKEGDEVRAFAPLVKGVEVTDWVKDPLWAKPFTSQGLLNDLEKIHSFLVQVDLEAFSLSTLLFVHEFLLRVKPARTKPIFLVRMRDLDADTVDINDLLSMQGTLELFASPYVHAFSGPLDDQPNVNSYQASAGMLDQPDPSPGPNVPPSSLYSGATKSAFNTDIDPTTPFAVVWFDENISAWGLDVGVLSPQQMIQARLSVNYNGSDPMTLFEDVADPLFQPLLEGESLSYGRLWVPAFSGAGIQLAGPTAPQSNFTITYLEARIRGVPPAGGRTYTVRVYKNGSPWFEVELPHTVSGESAYTFGPSPATDPMPAGGPFNVTTDDVVQVGIFTTDPDRSDQALKHVSVVLGQGVSWDPAGPSLAAGTYYTLRTLLGYASWQPVAPSPNAFATWLPRSRATCHLPCTMIEGRERVGGKATTSSSPSAASGFREPSATPLSRQGRSRTLVP